jgi:hypothetical protein
MSAETSHRADLTLAPDLAAGMYALVEPIHLVTYFAPQARPAFEAAGLRGFWRGYFAGRSAVLGPIGPEPVTALFHGVASGAVARALPSVRSQHLRLLRRHREPDPRARVRGLFFAE